MVYYCVVPVCRNTSDTPEILMHPFPVNEGVKETWVAKIFNDQKGSCKSIRTMRVCSTHFKTDDYKLVCGKKVLNEEAEPSLFLSEPCTTVKTPIESFLPKKKKMKVEKVETSAESPSDNEEIDGDSKVDFENLPELILIEIFKYLNFTDKWNAAHTCRRWYDITRSSAVWSQVDVKVKSSLHMMKVLLILPSSVTHLNIYCDSFDRRCSVWLPDIMARLHERCPNLKTLIIENVFFSQRFCNVNLTTDHVLRFLEILNSKSSEEKNTGNIKAQRCLKECCSNTINCEKYIPQNRPRELSTFSMRNAHSFMSHLSSQISQFLPEVRVLDLTGSTAVKAVSIPFYLKIMNLEELYLVECPITNTAIESLLIHMKNLKVLDLEGSPDVDDETFEILIDHGQRLEKLFLGNTLIESFEIENSEAFPHLQRICLKNTSLENDEISYFIVEVPSLKYIDASFCMNLTILGIIGFEAHQHDKEFIYENEGDPEALCHHFKTK